MDCGGKAQRRHRFGFFGGTMKTRAETSKAVWLYRFPPHSKGNAPSHSIRFRPEGETEFLLLLFGWIKTESNPGTGQFELEAIVCSLNDQRFQKLKRKRAP